MHHTTGTEEVAEKSTCVDVLYEPGLTADWTFGVLASASRPALGPPTDFCAMGSGGEVRPGREADHSPPSTAEVREE
jgi:hypothetical protein